VSPDRSEICSGIACENHEGIYRAVAIIDPLEFQWRAERLALNGFNIRDPQPGDDLVSVASAMISATAVAARINDASCLTGVFADIIPANVVGYAPIRAGLIPVGFGFVINGVPISGVAFGDNDAGGNLRDAINDRSNATGVFGSVNENGHLVLAAIDGRNIHVESRDGNPLALDSLGVWASAAYPGRVVLGSQEAFGISWPPNLATWDSPVIPQFGSVNFVQPTAESDEFEWFANVGSQFVTRVEGIDVRRPLPADDRLSSHFHEFSAIAQAAALNDSLGAFGIRANPVETILISDVVGDGSFGTGVVAINGVSLGASEFLFGDRT